MKRSFSLGVALVAAFALALPGTASATSKVKFKYPKRLDQLKVAVRVIPATALDPANESLVLSLSNVDGELFSETLPAGFLLPNSRGNRWLYKVKKDGSEQIFKAVVKERVDRQTGVLEYRLKMKVEADLEGADPARNLAHSEQELANMTLQISIGDDTFALNSNWERRPKNPSSPVKLWLLPDKYIPQAAAPTCTDGIQNQDETDVDCGGTVCPACENGDSCLDDGDCQSGNCASGTCQPSGPSCTDGIQNQDETDVDCGGLICPSCPSGSVCQVNGDCTSGFCDPSDSCAGVVFVTGQTFNGNLGDLAGADQKCQDAATAAGLTGMFLAWVSNDFGSPATRFSKDLAYARVDGIPVADSWGDLVDDTIQNPIRITETGATYTGSVWTGTTAAGVEHPSTSSTNCLDWNSSSPLETARYGSAGFTTSIWSSDAHADCSQSYALYCFEDSGSSLEPSCCESIDFALCGYFTSEVECVNAFAGPVNLVPGGVCMETGLCETTGDPALGHCCDGFSYGCLAGPEFDGPDSCTAIGGDYTPGTCEPDGGCMSFPGHSDIDGIPDTLDNCPTVPNVDQTNSDGDTWGDACDNCPFDDNQSQTNSDGDSWGDACDNCPLLDNESQTNSDIDSHGDACDNCPTFANESQTNSDNDSHGDSCDNCALVDNEDQTNSDTDGRGDACDNCPLVDNQSQAGPPTGPGYACSKTVFVTIIKYSGDLVNLGMVPDGAHPGLEEADYQCQVIAINFGLPGTYRAWLSDSTAWPANRFALPQNDPYVLTDGTVVADDWDDLIDCTNPDCLQHPINRHEDGSIAFPDPGLNPTAWTGTTEYGTVSVHDYCSDPDDCETLIETCDDWTTANTPLRPLAYFGRFDSTDDDWTQWSSGACFGSRPLYCFEQ